MTNEKKTQYFIDMYISCLREATGNKWLQAPKEGSEKWQELDKARQIVDDMGANYEDYIRYQFKALKFIKVFPKPAHLCSTKGVERYLKYTKRGVKKVVKARYVVEKDRFIVNSTHRTYTMDQASSPINDDSDAIFASHIVTTNAQPRDDRECEDWVDVMEYFLAKLEYLGKKPTEPMLRKLKELREGGMPF